MSWRGNFEQSHTKSPLFLAQLTSNDPFFQICTPTDPTFIIREGGVGLFFSIWPFRILIKIIGPCKKLTENPDVDITNFLFFSAFFFLYQICCLRLTLTETVCKQSNDNILIWCRHIWYITYFKKIIYKIIYFNELVLYLYNTMNLCETVITTFPGDIHNLHKVQS